MHRCCGVALADVSLVAEPADEAATPAEGGGEEGGGGGAGGAGGAEAVAALPAACQELLQLGAAPRQQAQPVGRGEVTVPKSAVAATTEYGQPVPAGPGRRADKTEPLPPLKLEAATRELEPDLIIVVEPLTAASADTPGAAVTSVTAETAVDQAGQADTVEGSSWDVESIGIAACRQKLGMDGTGGTRDIASEVFSGKAGSGESGNGTDDFLRRPSSQCSSVQMPLAESAMPQAGTPSVVNFGEGHKSHEDHVLSDGDLPLDEDASAILPRDEFYIRGSSAELRRMTTVGSAALCETDMMFAGIAAGPAQSDEGASAESAPGNRAKDSRASHFECPAIPELGVLRIEQRRATLGSTPPPLEPSNAKPQRLAQPSRSAAQRHSVANLPRATRRVSSLYHSSDGSGESSSSRDSLWHVAQHYKSSPCKLFSSNPDEDAAAAETEAAPASRPALGRRPRPEAGETPEALCASVRRLDLPAVKQLLSAGVSANTPHAGSSGDASFITLLHELCNARVEASGSPPANSVAILEAVLEARANVNPRSSVGCTPLMRACGRSNFDFVKLLVEYRAEVALEDDKGYSPLRWAIVLDRGESKEARGGGKPSSLCSGAGSDDEDGLSSTSTPDDAAGFTVASQWSVSAQIVRLIIDGCPCARDHAIRTSTDGNILKLRRTSTGGLNGEDHFLSLGQGAGIKYRYCKGTRRSDVPLLLEAVMCRNYEAAGALLEAGAQPRYLREAVATCSLECVRVLLQYKANPMDQDDNGESAMDIALMISEDNGIMDTLREAARTSNHGGVIVLGANTGSPGGRDSSKRLKGSRRLSTLSAGIRRNQDALLPVGYTLAQLQANQHVGLRRRLGAFVASRWGWFRQQAQPYAVQLSKACRRLTHRQGFQTVMMVLLFGALFLPDTWILLDAPSDRPIDVMIILIFIGFTVEFSVQIIGLWQSYLFTIFFYMDIIGAASVLLDLSALRREVSADKSAVGGNTVVMRAARAARLGARAGRFMKLAKILRFLPGSGHEGDATVQVSTAKGITQELIQKISTRVACLIIVMVVVLPLFNIANYQEQDGSMRLWTEQLARVAATRAGDEVQQCVADMRAFFGDLNYAPFLIRRRAGEPGEDPAVVWQTRGPLRSDNELLLSSGDVMVSFDLSGPHRVEAATNCATIVFTVLLMMSFALLISKPVSTIALFPLEKILAQVTSIGSTIYGKVEVMHRQMKDWQTCSMSSSISEDGNKNADLDYAAETVLLEKVVKKLAALSEITMQEAKPADPETLQYIGELLSPKECLRMSRSDTEAQLDHRRADSSRESVADYLPDDCLTDDRCAKVVFSWDFNSLVLNYAQSRAVCAAMLSCVAGRVIELDESVLRAFVETAGENYQDEPQYHNWYHAVDVTHVLLMFLHECGRQNVLLSWLEEFALLASAVCHDIGHPGVNNDFLVQISHELAIRYNDTSPLENMHCACLFEILHNHRSAIFAPLSKERYKEVRSICIEVILHTDNVHHIGMLKALQMFGEVHSEMLARARDVRQKSGSSEGTETWPPSDLVGALWEPDARRMLRNVLLHFSDISNQAQPFDLCKNWAFRILDEFFTQGDLEKEAGLPVGPLNDRERVSCPFSQISFIEFFVAPLAFATVRILSPLESLVEELLGNASQWVEEWVAEATPAQEEVASVLGRLRRLEERSPVPKKDPSRPPLSRSSLCSRKSGRRCLARE